MHRIESSEIGCDRIAKWQTGITNPLRDAFRELVRAKIIVVRDILAAVAERKW